MIKNLNFEEKKIRKEHPEASISKIIIFNYRENLRKIGLEHAQELTKINKIYIVFGNEINLEDGEEILEGWKDENSK